MASLRTRLFGLPRRIPEVAVLLFACAAIPTGAAAADYPDRPIRLIIPSAAGGGTDLSWRRLEPKLTELLGQPLIFENRPGASGNVGAAAVAQAQPDGYTLLAVISSNTINPSIMKDVPYDIEKDFAPVSLTVTLPNVLVSKPSLPAKDVKELVAYAKARPGQLDFASAGVGSAPHLMMELFLNKTGLKMQHIPYKAAAPGFNDVVAGHVALMAGNILTAAPYVQAGSLRAYGVTSSKRSTAAPNIPTLAEAGVPGYDAVQWFGMLAPAGTPRPIVEKLHGAIVKVLTDPSVRDGLIRDGVDPKPSATPEEFGAFIHAEKVKWAQVVKDAGLAQQ